MATNELIAKINAGFVEVATQIRQKTAGIGNLLNLTTSAKGTLVDALNEVNTIAKNAAGGGPATPIDEVATQKSNDLFARVSGGSSEALDSFKELADQLAADRSGAAGMTAAIAEKVSFNTAQTLTSAQQLQARQNIGAVASADIGDIATADFVGAFRTAMTA
jgi:hypothetical protein